MTDHLMKSAGQLRTTLVGLYMVAMAMLLTYIVFCLFPERVSGENNKMVWNTVLKVFRYESSVSAETRLLLLVMTMGALGSYVHAATSFVSYVGNRSFIQSWTWWYVLRPFIGVALAVIFYFVVRGGFLSAGADASDTSYVLTYDGRISMATLYDVVAQSRFRDGKRLRRGEGSPGPDVFRRWYFSW